MIPESLPSDLRDAFDGARQRLGHFASPLLYFSTIGSTNDAATELAARGTAEGAVVVADAQTAGRGRRGRTWFSPPMSGLYISIVLDPRAALGAAAAEVFARVRGLLTITAGVALAEGVQWSTGLPIDLKWPNDLIVDSRKLAGILAEGVTGDRVVLGYGINVGPMAYPPELAGRATSLELELGRPIDRAALAVETLAAIRRRYDDLLAGRFDAILDAWRERSPGSRGRRVSWETPSGPRTGTTAGIDETGALLVNADGAVERLVAGEVVWV